jgi:hypothetical protein
MADNPAIKRFPYLLYYFHKSAPAALYEDILD